MQRATSRTHERRRRVYEILERGDPSDAVSVAIYRLTVALIVLNLTAVALETVPEFNSRYGFLFELIEATSLLFFTVEYVLRLWVAVEHTPFQHLSPLSARLQYAVSAPGLIDLIAVLPFWFAFLLPPDLARHTGDANDPFSEDRALFGCDAIAARCTLW